MKAPLLELIKCEYKMICWRLAYSRRLIETPYKNESPPTRLEMYCDGFVPNIEMLDKGGQGGIFAKRFPSVQQGQKKNLCPCITASNVSNIMLQCVEYKHKKAVEKRLSDKTKNREKFGQKRAKIPYETRCQVADKYKYKCKYCGVSVRHRQCHVDHIIPLSRGGTDDFDNLALACVDCNQRKYNKIYFEAAKKTEAAIEGL
jgi:5-methylcytosine-specific restriction endonuclease McrA